MQQLSLKWAVAFFQTEWQHEHFPFLTSDTTSHCSLMNGKQLSLKQALCAYSYARARAESEVKCKQETFLIGLWRCSGWLFHKMYGCRAWRLFPGLHPAAYVRSTVISIQHTVPQSRLQKTVQSQTAALFHEAMRCLSARFTKPLTGQCTHAHNLIWIISGNGDRQQTKTATETKVRQLRSRHYEG